MNCPLTHDISAAPQSTRTTPCADTPWFKSSQFALNMAFCGLVATLFGLFGFLITVVLDWPPFSRYFALAMLCMLSLAPICFLKSRSAMSFSAFVHVLTVGILLLSLTFTVPGADSLSTGCISLIVSASVWALLIRRPLIIGLWMIVLIVGLVLINARNLNIFTDESVYTFASQITTLIVTISLTVFFGILTSQARFNRWPIRILSWIPYTATLLLIPAVLYHSETDSLLYNPIWLILYVAPCVVWLYARRPESLVSFFAYIGLTLFTAPYWNIAYALAFVVLVYYSRRFFRDDTPHPDDVAKGTPPLFVLHHFTGFVSSTFAALFISSLVYFWCLWGQQTLLFKHLLYVGTTLICVLLELIRRHLTPPERLRPENKNAIEWAAFICAYIAINSLPYATTPLWPQGLALTPELYKGLILGIDVLLMLFFWRRLYGAGVFVTFVMMSVFFSEWIFVFAAVAITIIAYMSTQAAFNATWVSRHRSLRPIRLGLEFYLTFALIYFYLTPYVSTPIIERQATLYSIVLGLCAVAIFLAMTYAMKSLQRVSWLRSLLATTGLVFFIVLGSYLAATDVSDFPVAIYYSVFRYLLLTFGTLTLLAGTSYIFWLRRRQASFGLLITGTILVSLTFPFIMTALYNVNLNPWPRMGVLLTCAGVGFLWMGFVLVVRFHHTWARFKAHVQPHPVHGVITLLFLIFVIGFYSRTGTIAEVGERYTFQIQRVTKEPLGFGTFFSLEYETDHQTALWTQAQHALNTTSPLTLACLRPIRPLGTEVIAFTQNAKNCPFTTSIVLPTDLSVKGAHLPRRVIFSPSFAPLMDQARYVEIRCIANDCRLVNLLNDQGQTLSTPPRSTFLTPEF